MHEAAMALVPVVVVLIAAISREATLGEAALVVAVPGEVEIKRMPKARQVGRRLRDRLRLLQVAVVAAADRVAFRISVWWRMPTISRRRPIPVWGRDLERASVRMTRRAPMKRFW